MLKSLFFCFVRFAFAEYFYQDEKEADMTQTFSTCALPGIPKAIVSIKLLLFE